MGQGAALGFAVVKPRTIGYATRCYQMEESGLSSAGQLYQEHGHSFHNTSKPGALKVLWKYAERIHVKDKWDLSRLAGSAAGSARMRGAVVWNGISIST